MLRDKIRTAFFIVSSMLIHSAALLAITMSPGFLQKMSESIGSTNFGEAGTKGEIIEVTADNDEIIVVEEPAVEAVAEPATEIHAQPVAVEPIKPMASKDPSKMDVTLIKKSDLKSEDIQPEPQKKIAKAKSKKASAALPEKIKNEKTEVNEQKVVVFEETEEPSTEITADENLSDMAAAVATSEVASEENQEIKSETMKELATGPAALPAPEITPEPKATSPAEKMVATNKVVSNTEPIDQPEIVETAKSEAFTAEPSESAELAAATTELSDEAEATSTAETTEIAESTETTEVAATTETVAAEENASPVVVENPAPATAATTTANSNAQVFYNLKQLAGNQPPVYPESARFKKAEGAGELRYMVTKDGRVKDLELLQSTGHKDLDVAMMSAVKDYRFVPGQEGVTVHPFAFKLKGPELPTKGRLRTTLNREPVQ